MYVDTSVLVSFYTGEELGHAAEAVLLGDASPAVSGLSEVELFAALARKVRSEELDARQAQHVRTQFTKHLDNGNFVRIALEPAHYRMARDWLALVELPLGSKDAIHLAAAALASMTLLTADAQQARAAEELGVEVMLLR